MQKVRKYAKCLWKTFPPHFSTRISYRIYQHTYIVDTLTYVKQMSKCVWICWANSFLGFRVVELVVKVRQHIKIRPDDGDLETSNENY